MPESTFQTFAGWKRAVRKVDPGARFEGNKDIAFAFSKNLRVAEWDGDSGVIEKRSSTRSINLQRKKKMPSTKLTTRVTAFTSKGIPAGSFITSPRSLASDLRTQGTPKFVSGFAVDGLGMVSVVRDQNNKVSGLTFLVDGTFETVPPTQKALKDLGRVDHLKGQLERAQRIAGSGHKITQRSLDR